MSFPPLLFALAAWFFGTAMVVWLDSRPRETFTRSFGWAGVAGGAAMIAIVITLRDPTPLGAYIGFAGAVLLWGWHELGFLMGFVSGPRRTPCPPGSRGWTRFRLATATVIHHELALAATLALLVALGWGQANPVAPLTFALLFAMRLSAKLNLYLGVSSLSDELFPAHLAYLKSYFGTARRNALLPLSVVGGLAATGFAWHAADRAATAGAATGYALVAGLALLGVAEHLLLVLPVRDAALWRWATSRFQTKTISGERLYDGL